MENSLAPGLRWKDKKMVLCPELVELIEINKSITKLQTCFRNILVYTGSVKDLFNGLFFLSMKNTCFDQLMSYSYWHPFHLEFCSTEINLLFILDQTNHKKTYNMTFLPNRTVGLLLYFFNLLLTLIWVGNLNMYGSCSMTYINIGLVRNVNNYFTNNHLIVSLLSCLEEQITAIATP